jgi:hypothetical protein
MISNDVYEKMVAMSTGRIPRDQAWLDEQARLGHTQEEAQAKAKYEKEHPQARSQRDLELEARAFDLKMFGKRHMEQYARPIGQDALALPGDAPHVKGHSASTVAPCRDASGRLLLQNHGGCGIRQKLELRTS